MFKKHVRASKYDSAVEKAELLDVNPHYAFVKLPSGMETTVSLREVAPCGKTTTSTPATSPDSQLLQMMLLVLLLLAHPMSYLIQLSFKKMRGLYQFPLMQLKHLKL